MDNQQQRLPKGKNVQRLKVLYLMKYIVYLTTNKINGKIYVGVHRTNPDIFDGYIGCGITHKDKKKGRTKGFPAAVRKYGYENFERKTLYIFPDTEEGKLAAYEKEAEIVNIEFVKSHMTYNLTVGGKWTVYENLKKCIAQYSLDGKFIRTWDSIKEAQETLGLTSISENLTGVSKYCGDFQWKYYTDESDIDPVIKKEKTVYQFDLKGNLLKVWKSATEASKEFKNPISAKTAIHNVCKNITRQAYGYYWSFKCKFEYVEYSPTKAVAKYTHDGIFVESYSSIKEAAENNNTSSTNISHAIKGDQKKCAGFRWRLYYGDQSNIAPLK